MLYFSFFCKIMKFNVQSQTKSIKLLLFTNDFNKTSNNNYLHKNTYKIFILLKYNIYIIFTVNTININKTFNTII